MKIKSLPEDFVVTEVSSRQPTSGAYSLYRLDKRSIGTLEALKTIRGHWNLASNQVSHAGLKDRHAETSQLITIRQGPRCDHKTDLIQLSFLGRTDSHIAADDIIGNHFRIAIRNLKESQCQDLAKRVDRLSRNGIPNYFDSQRFGSLGPSKKFVAAAWCRKDYEQATWLALAEFNHHDRPEQRRDKQFLRDHWGEWSLCKSDIGRSNRRSVVTYLVDHPENFRKAFALIDPDLRGLYLSAFQSAVWNRMLKKAVEQRPLTPPDIPEPSLKIVIGDSTLPCCSCPSLRGVKLPLPSARCKELSPEHAALFEHAVAEYDLTPETMKVSFPRDRWFSRSDRQALVFAEDLSVCFEEDLLAPNQRQAILDFTLPRGSYATMLVRMLTENTESAE